MAIQNPIRIDIAILTVKKQEAKSVIKIFKLNTPGKEEGFDYLWGFIETDSGKRVYIAHVSFDDKSGIAAATTAAGKICDILYPSYFLILGIAGGRQGNKKKGSAERVELGDVVVSKVIKHGPLNDNHLRENPVMQPNTVLYHSANGVDTLNLWRDFIPTEPGPPAISKSNVHFEELLSTDQIIENLLQDPRYNEVFKKFPRVAVVDMEAGGVANLLLERYSDGKWTPHLFVIKGISDIIDKKVSKKQKEERHLWRSYAAEAAAAFALALIPSFDISTPNHAKRFLPTRLRDRSINFDTSGVLHSIEPEHYSKIATHILQAIVHSEDYMNCLFFTVCAYDPDMLWETVRKRFIHEKQFEPSNGTLMDWTLDNFDHFKVFGEQAANQAANQADNCVRILILEGSTNEEDVKNKWTANITPANWELFMRVNCGIPCWGVGRRDIKSIDKEGLFITDYVLIGDKILLDYYNESKTLIISDLSDDVIIGQLLGLYEGFIKKKNENNLLPFKDLPTLNQEAEQSFKQKDQYD